MNSSNPKVDISKYSSPISGANKLARGIWQIVWLLFFRPSPTFLFAWRRFLLRLFGARMGRRANVYPSCRVWAPWNLEMGDFSSMSHYVDCYSVAKVTIGSNATVSQYSFLCTATHDISDPRMKLVTAPIRVSDSAWVCADVFVAPNVTLGDGAVAAARAVVLHNVEPWTVVAGNPAIFVKKRELRNP